MKQFFTLFIALLVSTAAFAQPCTPDSSFQQSPLGFYPHTQNDTVSIPACAGEPISYAITVVTPSTFNFLPLQSFEMLSLTGLPPGVNFTCYTPDDNGNNANDCVFHPADNGNPANLGCIIISGVPSTTGHFDIEMQVRINNFFNQNIPGNLFRYAYHIVIDSVCGVAISSDGGDTELCPNEILTLTASPGFDTYQWHVNNNPIAGATGTTYDADQPGQYFVVAGNNGGQVDTSNYLNIIDDTSFAAVITPGDSVLICLGGGNATLAANQGPGYTYQWYYGNFPVFINGTSDSLSPILPGNYTVRVSTPDGCSATSDPVNVQISVAPITAIVPLGTAAFCPEDDPVLTAVPALPGYTYQWLYIAIPLPGETNPELTVNLPGLYIVSVTNAAGCTATSTPTLATFVPSPSVDLTPENTTICEGETVQLSTEANNGDSYDWGHDGNNIPGATDGFYDATDGGTYTLTVTSGDGCTAVDSAHINMIPGPGAQFTATVVGAGIFDFTPATPGMTYLWDFGDGTTSTDPAPSHTYGQNGTYTVTLTVTDPATGCVSVYTMPVEVLNIGIFSPEVEGLEAQLISDGNGGLVLDFNYIQSARISWTLWDAAGKAIASNTAQEFAAGNHRFSVGGTQLSSGVYFMELKIANGCSLLLKGVVR